MMEPADIPHDRQARTDFETWCRECRLLGRDRLQPAFVAGWRAGFEAAAEQMAGQHPATEGHDQ